MVYKECRSMHDPIRASFPYMSAFVMQWLAPVSLGLMVTALTIAAALLLAKYKQQQRIRPAEPPCPAPKEAWLPDEAESN